MRMRRFSPADISPMGCWARWLAPMRVRAWAARVRMGSVTTRLGHRVEALKKPAMTASCPMVRAVVLPALSAAVRVKDCRPGRESETTPKCWRSWVRSQRGRPKMAISG